MKYLTVVLRYDTEKELNENLPEMDDKLLGGEVTNFMNYDAANVANVAINAVSDAATIETIAAIVKGD